MDQSAINIIMAVAGFMCAFVLTAVWARLGKLEASDGDLAKEIAAIHILVAGEYIKRDEIAPQIKGIYDELRAINSELSKKLERRATD